jgi:hypothetical protein
MARPKNAAEGGRPEGFDPHLPPRTLRELAHHRPELEPDPSKLLHLLAGGRDLPPVIELSGEMARTAARLLAAAVNCEARVDGDACGGCASCNATLAFRGFAVIEVDAAHDTVSYLKKVQEHLLHAQAVRWQIVVVDRINARDRKRGFGKALAAMLSSPAPQATFVLIAAG